MALPSRLRRAGRWLASERRRLLRMNFYRCHMAYFVITILISSAIMYASTGSPSATDSPAYKTFRISYPDALFMAASAMTTTGLNTINLSNATGYQQSVLFVLMLLGDLSTVSISVVFVRRWFFRKRICQWTRESRTARRVLEEIDAEKASSTSRGRTMGREADLSSSTEVDNGSSSAEQGHRQAETSSASKGSSQDSWKAIKSLNRMRKLASHEKALGGWNTPWQTRIWKSVFSALFRRLGPSSTPEQHHYLSFVPKLDAKGRFRSLNKDQYHELGGVEYRALALLSWLLPTYTAFWIFLTMIILAPYAAHYGPVAETIRTSQPGDLRPAWWGVFVSLASYTNSGLDLLNPSMIPFQSNYFILIVTGVSILAGNAFYPIFLRFFIWTLWKLVPKDSSMHHSLTFLLQHPRRCYLFLFDRNTTWILTAVQLTVVLGEWIMFELLNINQTAVWALAPGTRAIDGIYQSLGTRSSGFYIVTISSFAPALQVLYIVTMYMSAFPILISLRRTNLYEERSIGLDVDEYDSNLSPIERKLKKKKENKKKKAMGESVEKSKSHTAQHVRNQLAYDLWWIMLSWFVICIIEEPQLNTDAPGFDLFAVLFEVVSAYGNVGLSLGVPYDDYSLCGQFHALSKLVLITVMLRGRHRILPMAIDRSILLPGQGLMEEMDRHYNTPDGEAEIIDKIRSAESCRDRDGAEAEQDPEPENLKGRQLDVSEDEEGSYGDRRGEQSPSPRGQAALRHGRTGR